MKDILRDAWAWLTCYDGWIPVLFGAILAACAAGLVFAVKADDRNFDIFMKQCQQDHKEYECYSMWRAGRETVVPVYVPIVVR